MSSSGGGRRPKRSEADSAAVHVPGPCASTQRALAECHRRAARGPLQAEVLCRHINRALAECVVTMCCPGETEAVRTLCGSSGTALKRSQCQRARIDLSLCLEAHQEVWLGLQRVWDKMIPFYTSGSLSAGALSRA